MPIKKHGKWDNIFTYSNIMICHVPSLYRYTPIYQYKGEIRPCHYAAPLIQSPPRPSSRDVFRPCLPIYSKTHIFTTWANIPPIPHNIAKRIFADLAPYSIRPHIANHSPHSMRSDLVTLQASQPANHANIIPRHRFWQHQIKLHGGTATGADQSKHGTA